MKKQMTLQQFRQLYSKKKLVILLQQRNVVLYNIISRFTVYPFRFNMETVTSLRVT